MWEERGVTYRPDIAVFGFYHRDFLRNALFFKSYLKPYFTLREDDSLELHTEHLMSPQALHEEYVSGRRRVGGWHYSQGYAAVHRILTQWRWIDREDADWRRMAAILRRFRDSALEVGAQPFLLVIPEQGYKVQGGQFEDIDRLALAEARTLGLPALSIREAFNSTDDRKRAAPFFRADGHLTEVGNCEMARHLAMALEDQGLVGDALGDPSGFSCAEDVR